MTTLSPRLGFSGLASLGDTTISFLGEAMDPAREGELAGSVLIEEGEALVAHVAREIIMGRGLAANLGVKVGDTVVLLANTRSGGINAVETQSARPVLDDHQGVRRRRAARAAGDRAGAAADDRGAPLGSASQQHRGDPGDDS